MRASQLRMCCWGCELVPRPIAWRCGMFLRSLNSAIAGARLLAGLCVAFRRHLSLRA